MGVLGLFPQSKSSVEKLYYENEAELKSVASFLQEEENASIRADLFDTTEYMIYYVPHGKLNVKISNSNMIMAVEKLKRAGFIRILKEYNYISFQSWESMGESRGLMYTKGEEPDLSKLNVISTQVEEIGQNWYYCRIQYE